MKAKLSLLAAVFAAAQILLPSGVTAKGISELRPLDQIGEKIPNVPASCQPPIPTGNLRSVPHYEQSFLYRAVFKESVLRDAGVIFRRQLKSGEEIDNSIWKFMREGFKISEELSGISLDGLSVDSNRRKSCIQFFHPSSIGVRSCKSEGVRPQILKVFAVSSSQDCVYLEYALMGVIQLYPDAPKEFEMRFRLHLVASKIENSSSSDELFDQGIYKVNRRGYCRLIRKFNRESRKFPRKLKELVSVEFETDGEAPRIFLYC